MEAAKIKHLININNERKLELLLRIISELNWERWRYPGKSRLDWKVVSCSEIIKTRYKFFLVSNFLRRDVDFVLHRISWDEIWILSCIEFLKTRYGICLALNFSRIFRDQIWIFSNEKRPGWERVRGREIEIEGDR